MDVGDGVCPCSSKTSSYSREWPIAAEYFAIWLAASAEVARHGTMSTSQWRHVSGRVPGVASRIHSSSHVTVARRSPQRVLRAGAQHTAGVQYTHTSTLYGREGVCRAISESVREPSLRAQQLVEGEEEGKKVLVACAY